MDELEKLLEKHRQEKAKGKDNSTADEMFRELGYTWEGTPNGNGREYEGETGDTVTVTRFGATFKDPGMEKGVRIGRDYILACAQLIREMSDPVYPLLEDDPHFVPGLVSEV